MKRYTYFIIVGLIFIYFLYSFMTSSVNIIIDGLITLIFINVYYRFNLHNVKKLKRYLTLPLIFPIYLLSLCDYQFGQGIIDFWRYISLIVIVIDYAYGPIERWLFTNKRYWIIILMVSLQFFGTIGFYKFESLSINQSFWLTFISATTVGYGDLSATTTLGQLVTYIIVLTGNLIYGAILIGLMINWLKSREANGYSEHESIKMEFERFRRGKSSIDELEHNVMNKIKKENR